MAVLGKTNQPGNTNQYQEWHQRIWRLIGPSLSGSPLAPVCKVLIWKRARTASVGQSNKKGCIDDDGSIFRHKGHLAHIWPLEEDAVLEVGWSLDSKSFRVASFPGPSQLQRFPPQFWRTEAIWVHLTPAGPGIMRGALCPPRASVPRGIV